MKTISFTAALALASVISLSLPLQAQAAASSQAKSACQFKTAFKKTAAGSTWTVKECFVDGSERFQISHEDPRLGTQKARITHADGEGLTGIDYQLLSPTTLLVNMQGERGGHALLLHPVKRGETLSSLRFDFMTFDDTALQIMQQGDVIHATTEFDDVIISIDAPGTLRTVRVLKKDPRPHSQK